jgi:hypothetical protein
MWDNQHIISNIPPQTQGGNLWNLEFASWTQHWRRGDDVRFGSIGSSWTAATFGPERANYELTWKPTKGWNDMGLKQYHKCQITNNRPTMDQIWNPTMDWKWPGFETIPQKPNTSQWPKNSQNNVGNFGNFETMCWVVYNPVWRTYFFCFFVFFLLRANCGLNNEPG